MEFSDNKPIYKQIEEHFFRNILSEKWEEGERVPSVREIAVLMEVNPNTALRAFQELQDLGILNNKRGVGYFLGEDARSLVLKIRKEEFLQNKVPLLFREMKLLDIDISELDDLYRELIADS